MKGGIVSKYSVTASTGQAIPRELRLRSYAREGGAEGTCRLAHTLNES